jgi:hypothetical protein
MKLVPRSQPNHDRQCGPILTNLVITYGCGSGSSVFGLALVRLFHAWRCRAASRQTTHTEVDSGIDTVGNKIITTHSTAAPIILNEHKLSRKDGPRTRVSVSKSPVPEPVREPVTYRLAWERDLMAKRDAEDLKWGLTAKQLRSSNGGLSLYRVINWSAAGDVSVQILARSDEDAKAMFTSVWGQGYRIGAANIGLTRDEEEIATWLSGWREQLKKQFEEWKATDQGKRSFGKIQAENREKWVAEQRQHAMDEAVAACEADWEEDYLAEIRAKRSAQFQRARPSQSGYSDPDEPEDDEYGEEERDY